MSTTQSEIASVHASDALHKARRTQLEIEELKRELSVLKDQVESLERTIRQLERKLA